MAEIKPKSFRIDDETSEKIKQIASDIGGNQQETLSKLIESYEFQKGKSVIPERRAEIETFENHANILTRMFMKNLEENQNTKELIRSEFDAQLISKDTIIKELQDKAGSLKSETEKSTLVANSLGTENIALNEENQELKRTIADKIKQMIDAVKDKDDLNQALTSACNEQKKQIEVSKQEIELAKENISKMHKFEIEKEKTEQALKQKEVELVKEKGIQTLKEKEKEMTDYKRMSERDAQKSINDQKLTFELKILDIEKHHQKEIKELEEEKRKEIDNYQKKYLELLEKLNEKKV